MRCFQHLEKKIKTKNSQNLILLDNDSGEELTQNSILSPRMYSKDGKFYCIFKESKLNEFSSFIDGFIYLYGVYFSFDLIYPDCYKKVLGLFHQFLFPEFKNVFKNAEVNRNLGYINIFSVLSKKL